MNHSSPCKILCLNVKKRKHKQTNKNENQSKSPYYGTVVTSETILLINYCINEAKKRNLKGYSNTTAFIRNKNKTNTHTREGTKHIYHNPTHSQTTAETTHSQL